MADNDDELDMEETEQDVENVDPQPSKGPEWDHTREVMVCGKKRVQCIYCCKNMAACVSATRVRFVLTCAYLFRILNLHMYLSQAAPHWGTRPGQALFKSARGSCDFLQEAAKEKGG
jgi:hypothetical protein